MELHWPESFPEELQKIRLRQTTTGGFYPVFASECQLSAIFLDYVPYRTSPRQRSALLRRPSSTPPSLNFLNAQSKTLMR